MNEMREKRDPNIVQMSDLPILDDCLNTIIPNDSNDESNNESMDIISFIHENQENTNEFYDMIQEMMNMDNLFESCVYMIHEANYKQYWEEYIENIVEACIDTNRFSLLTKLYKLSL